MFFSRRDFEEVTCGFQMTGLSVRAYSLGFQYERTVWAFSASVHSGLSMQTYSLSFQCKRTARTSPRYFLEMLLVRHGHAESSGSKIGHLKPALE